MNKAEKLLWLADSIQKANTLATRKENQIECTSFVEEDKELVILALRLVAKGLEL